MKRRLIQSRAGQYTWLQVLALVLSAVGYLAGSMLMAIVMLLLATIFGVVATMDRVKRAREELQQNPRSRPRR